MGNRFFQIFIIFLLTASPLISFGQKDYLKAQVAKEKKKWKKVYGSEVVDSVFGIEIYEKYNYHLGDDSIRNCRGGYACQQWVTDHYTNGKIIHKGFYIDGQLRAYKNYFDNGNLEREFKSLDNFRSQIKKYHRNGNMKSEVRYLVDIPMKWTDYYANGQVEYEEEFNRGLGIPEKKNFYYPDGTPKELMLMMNKKKRLFSKKKFYENGQVAEEGELRYVEDNLDFWKTGKWMEYNKEGKLLRERVFVKGQLSKEKKF